MNTILKRVISLFLCFVMIVGYVPANAFAAEIGETVTAETTDVTAEQTEAASEETEAPSESTESLAELSEVTDDSDEEEEETEKESEKEEKETEKESEKEEKETEKESKKAEKEAEKESKQEAKQEKPVSAEETSGILTASTETAAISAEAVAPSTGVTEPEVIAVTGITLDRTALEVSVGELPMTLTATVLPENATDKTVTWASSEPGVASVEDGVLSFGYMGKAVITATAGEFSASCTVTVDEGEWSGYADNTKDYLFVATDRHANTSVIGNIINNMESAIGENELDYLALGGDMVGSGNTHPTYNSSTVLAEVTGAISSLSAANVDIVAGVHDMNVTDDSGIVLPYQGGGAQIYEGDRFYVYGVEEYCISEDSNESNWSSEAQKFIDWANADDIDKSKVIIVVSHYPLHAKRDDNDGAYYWHQALNTVATGAASDDNTVERDIVFFHGHNHTKDSNEYVYNVGDTMSIQNGSSTTSDTIYYTYATAGYLNQNSKATLVTITDDAIALEKYTTSGSGTDMATVTRAAEAVTLSSIAISGTTSYTVGEELDLTVTATYSDGTTADVTANATLSGYDMSAAGKYTVKAEYEGQTATIEITVSEAETSEPTENTVYTYDGNYYIGATGLGLKSIAASYVYADYADLMQSNFDNGTGVIYEIALEGYTEGNEVTYQFALDETVPVQNLGVFSVADGTLTAIDYEIIKEEGVTFIRFKTNKAGIFAYGTVNVPDGYTLSELVVTNGRASDYFVSDSFELYLVTVTAIYKNESGETFERELYEYDGEYITDGYTWTRADMTTAGKQTLTFTYKDETATLDIYVWGETFADETTGVTVKVGEAEYGVTAATVTESVNTNVANAVQGFLEADTYVAYDITLNCTEGYATNDAPKTVTLPIPEGVTNPVVYYVSDDGATVEKMPTTKNDDGTLTFTTTHFSTYVVGESTEIEVPDAETATGSGETTTTTKKTVYVQTSSISSGNDYLIVNGNSAGSYYALANNSGSVAATGVTVKTDSKIGTYIELDDAADELWTCSANIGSNTSSTLKNGNYYLYISSSGGLSLVDETGNYTNWRLNGSQLYRYRRNNISYYLRYNNGWTTTSSSNSASSIYFYVPTEVEVETTTGVSGTYSIAGNPAEVTKVVTNGFTAELNSVLTFVPSNGGSATTTENPSGVTYEIYSDPSGILSGISGNTVTFTGKYGKALVKVSYTTSFGNVTNYITVNASEPTYVLDITDGGNVVTGTTITQKGVTGSTTLQLGTKIQFEDENGAEIVELPEGATIEWHIPEEYHGVATVGHDTGLVSFKGVNGAFYVTATLTVNGKDYTVGVNISATIDSYSVPSDGTSDFPEYPNEGAIRYDKTATAVGNFSETGIARVELSMTGVPYTTGSEIDVVLMLDMTGSMDDVTSNTSEPTGYVRVDATIAASKAFIETIVKNEDGSYNGNRVGVYVFNKNGAATLFDFGTVDSDTELEAIEDDLDSIYDDHYASGGTPYDDGLAKCQSVLSAAKTDGIGNDRQQFCVFMTDGVPTSYAYVNGTSYGTHSSASAIAGMLTSSDNYATRDTDYKYEYYSTEMKKAGVTVYSVGIGLENTNNAWSGTATQCLNLASALLNDISGPANETVQPDGVGSSTHTKKDSYFFSVEDATAATDMEKVFTNIAMKILQAATDVTVEDQVGDDYTMIFDIPTTTTENGPEIEGVTNDFYIEFLKYQLDENHERTTSTSVTKLYLKNTSGVLSAAKDSSGTAYDAPVFEQKTVGDKGTLYYWSTNAADGDSDVSVTVDGTTYYFVSYGMEEAGYNMTSGGYAYGTVGDANMSENLVIATPYFVYNAATKMLYWTVDKLDTYEYALRYFVYLNNSATEVGTANEADPGSYLTNDHAYITYTNFNGNECRQEFPKPQLTWNGAQVSYVFYLVNAAGQPINKSGQVVDFANATFITDIYTESVVWNKEGDTATGTGQLSADWLADDKLPDEYDIYDEQARYVLNVYENADGTTIKNQFTISGNTADNISSSLNTRLDLETTASTVSVNTTKVYNTKAGEKISAYGTYTSADSNMKDFDFANTTVAFAVVWQPRLVEDVVVVDYGLDVLINVVQNDILQNTVSGIGVGKDAYEKENIAINSGVATTAKLGTAALTIEGNTISIENENSVRFHQGDMQFDKPVEFYYETPVEFWEGSDPTEGYMYSSVTVIPATTIYYEDDFLTLTSFSKGDNGWTEDETSQWSSSAQNGVQDQDRPGESQISAAIDADNNYGYDSAYETMSTHSLNNSAHITVDANTRGEATFTFYGTGFDIVGLTSNTTGTLTIKVYSGDEVSGDPVKTTAVDTYYGYIFESKDMDSDGTISDGEGEWVISTNTPNTLYQVPVMKISDLDYGQYTVKITAGYSTYFDHTSNGSYDLYLDAIRIYDPTGNQNQEANDAYVKDGEGWPTYFEVRNEIIDQATADQIGTEDAEGIVFIDGVPENASVSDYTSYGPNNETYLAAGQAIAFELNATATAGDIAKVQLAAKTVGGNASIKVYSTDGTTALDADITTATDMYYDITALNGKIVIIVNDGESGILSITNVKVTYTEEQPEASDPAPAMFMLRRSSVDEALATLNVEEEEIPETTLPDESVPETTVPVETEPEETEPEVTEPSETPTTEEAVQAITNVVKDVVNKVVNALNNLFGRWFR